MTALTEPVHRAIATRRRRGQTAEQLLSVGKRTGWWTADDIDWCFTDAEGPRPDGWTLDQVDQDPAPVTATALVASLAYREAAASVALDGETQVVGPSHVVEEPAVPAAPSMPLVTVDYGEDAPSSYVHVVAVSDVFADAYQRDVDQARVKRMAAAWNPRLVGVIDVADRGPGSPVGARWAVIAGQHRWLAGREHGEQFLAATIHEGLTVADEARMMHDLDRSTKKLSGHDNWRARRAAGDPLVLQVEAIAAVHGLSVGPAMQDGVLRSYGAAEKLLITGGQELLDQTLAVLGIAYGTSAAGYIAPLVSGVGQFIRSQNGVDLNRLGRALAGVRPEQLRATATQLREIETGTLAQLFVKAIARTYTRTRA